MGKWHKLYAARTNVASIDIHNHPLTSWRKETQSWEVHVDILQPGFGWHVWSSWNMFTYRKGVHFTTRNLRKSLMSSCIQWRQVEAQHHQPLRHWETRHARARDQTSHCNFRLKVKRSTLFNAELFAKLIFIYPPLPWAGKWHLREQLKSRRG